MYKQKQKYYNIEKRTLAEALNFMETKVSQFMDLKIVKNFEKP